MSLEQRLGRLLGREHVLEDPAVTASFCSDWTGRFSGRARAVVRPPNAEAVAAVLRECSVAGVPVCPQGGNTGLVGGSVPADGSVVLSTTRLAAVEVDELAAQASVGAGCPLAKLQQATRARGLDFGVDLAARDSCTLGGMYATNAGGERVLRYGSMRAQVLGVRAVLADGTAVGRLSGLPKDNTGYDLPALLAGSEGTLAVATELRVRLVARLPVRAVALVALPDVATALDLLTRLRAVLPSLEAAEFFFHDGLELVRGHTGAPAPFAEEHPVYVVVECAGRTDPTDELLAVLADHDGVRDATVASDPRGRHALWSYREAHTESVNALGVPVKLDVAVPLARLPEAVADLPGLVGEAAPGARTVLFGHLAEANLHVNVLGAGQHDESVTDAVLRAVTALDGSISAEHGIGRAKQRWLALTRSPAEIAVMTALKRALDPQGLLNPGVLLPAPSRQPVARSAPMV